MVARSMGGLVELGADDDRHSDLLACIQPRFWLVVVGIRNQPNARCTSNVPPSRNK